MPVNDPVGDMLTRLRNASRARHDKVVIPALEAEARDRSRSSRTRASSATSPSTSASRRARSPSQLKYGPDRAPAITGIQRVSKPGLRRYVHGARDSAACSAAWASPFSPRRSGVMVDTEARKQKVGGELLCTVY